MAIALKPTSTPPFVQKIILKNYNRSDFANIQKSLVA